MISLNLLPPRRLRHLATAVVLSRWRATAWLVTGSALLAVISLQAVSFWLNDRNDTLLTEVQTFDQQFDRSEAGAIRRQIKSLNAAADIFDQAMPMGRSWSADLGLLINSLPSNAALTELTLTANGEVRLAGISKIRADFLAFDEAIKKNGVLTNVQTTSTANRRENLPYQYTAQFQATQP